MKADAPPAKIPKTFKEIETVYKMELQSSDMNFIEFMKIFSNKKMIRGEIKFIWDTIDIDKNNKISQEEFEDFHEIFITPYEVLFKLNK